MCLGADEDFWSHVETNGRPKLPKEVIAAHEIGTTGKRALKTGSVKAHTLSSDSSRKFQLGALAEGRCIHSVHVIEKGTEWQLPLVKILFGPKSRVEADSQVV